MKKKHEIGEEYFSFGLIKRLGDEIRIEIQIGNMDIDISKEYETIRLLLFKGKKIYISGRGPIELYAMLSFHAIKNECQSLYIFEYNENDYFCIYDCNEKIKINTNLVSWFSEESRIISLNKSPAFDGKWNLKEIREELKCCKFCNEYNFLIIKGQGSLLFYSILGGAAALSSYENAYINKPKEKYLINFVNGRKEKEKNDALNGKIIGILGDPNSGKSVFAKLLEQVIKLYIDKSQNAWCLDCDEAARTPNWYINAIQKATTVETEKKIKETREQTKRKWTLELEQQVVEGLNNVRNSIDFIIADMPGGKHNEKENIHDRIPDEGRRNMIAACDYLVILSRKDNTLLYDEWIQALKKYNLEKKVIAEIVSGDFSALPKAEKQYIDEKGIIHITIHGLDRKTDSYELVKKTKNKLKILCDKITGQI